MTRPAVHVFERAGLGRAPYTLTAVEYLRFQACPGAPWRSGASCDYCGTGIVETCWLLSADGRRFKVGNDCIRRAGDRGLRRAIDADPTVRAARRARAQAQVARDVARIARAVDALSAVRSQLAALPHPNAALAGQGRTLTDWCEWMLAHAGRAGKLRVARLIEQALALADSNRSGDVVHPE